MLDQVIEPEKDYVAKLANKYKKQWQNITKARTDAIEVKKILYENLKYFTSEDVDVVVFGSLARQEWTTGSDVDWTMLIDGQANLEHKPIARKIAQVLGELEFKGKPLKHPGSEGIFGNMSFSHEIVHHIGGQSDTNRNMTQRILLLLEATSLRSFIISEDGSCERTIRQILNRYLEGDSNFHPQSNDESRIPRFLLNDIVRFWRTMCVDFAYKDWEQAGKKWALRNIKLRTSRKLLFVAGMLTVFSCFKNESLKRDGDYILKLQDHLLNFVHSTPLNIIVWTLQRIKREKDCVKLLDIYEQFLACMNKEPLRQHLESLNQEDVYVDKDFLECREISHQLQVVLQDICFKEESLLREFTCEYGVF
ncbi:nucleotidyltransferase domain-containing protein [Gimesia sp.]|uniref:nucleotidyltransferase domain-containing protein n=1 Tax=Gimesia sp. TaxID=2024833 RepID=UPI003A944B9A